MVAAETNLEFLDNPIYYALSTSQADLAIGDDLAKRYPPDYTCLAGLKDESDASFESLGKVTAGATVRIITTDDSIAVPKKWTIKNSFTVSQMTCPKLIECKEIEFETLTSNDVPAMLALAELAKPGPFYDRTIDLGTFVGIRDGDVLVAMAGQRMKLPGFEEISAVSTHPDYRSRGYARALVSGLSKLIHGRGNVPFLTVRTDNAAGIRSYESIGFRFRRSLRFNFIARN